MNILSINTSFSKSYVSVGTDKHKIYKHMDSSLKQSENILGLIDNALSLAEIEIKDLDAISCVIGPGSFTGIRIGASIAKGFCTVFKNINRVSICSLDLLAYTYSKNAKSSFWVVLNALSGNLFVCKYNQYGTRDGEPMLLNQNNINTINGVVVGLDEENLDLCNEFVSLSSEDLLNYSLELFNSYNYSSDFIPLYLRKSQAEAEYDKKMSNN